ncbi:MAG: AMP-binding protein [Syntrophobacterales bacterium]|nr:AMP-binding protein [Syntrophobacterales bacterium]
MREREYNLYDVIERNARLFPHREALVFGGSRLTFAQFKDRCDQLARGLSRRGVLKEDRLAVVAQNSDDYLVLYGAAARVGAVVVAVNWRLQAEELGYILADCAPKLVFADGEYGGLVSEAARGVGSVDGLYILGEGKEEGAFQRFDALSIPGGTERGEDVPVDAGFVIMYTAAVEGKPRGALLSQSNIVAIGVQLIHQFSLGQEDGHLCILPLFHIGGLSMAVAVMHAGGKNILIDRFDPSMSLELIERERATVFFSFPPILKSLADAHREKAFDLSTVRKVGGIDSPENIERFREIAPNAEFYVNYGQTEAMAVAGGKLSERPGSAGRPSLLTSVILFDDYDREVPPGSAGEICVRSPAVFLGYWGKDEETAYTFRNGWHHTGDIGRFDADGYLWYVKRKAVKELIKPGGENVYPAEVEKVLLAHPDVAEAAVIGVPDPEWGEAVKAVCVVKEGHAIDPLELSEFVAARIARYKKPKHVVFVKELPKKADGEVDRERVKQEHGGKY